jgi:hypothetical protein
MLADSAPKWTDILTAIGTVAAAFFALVAAIVAIWIAFWTDRRAAQRIERQRHDDNVKLMEERSAADDRLQRQFDHTKQIEQLADAYLVEVTSAFSRSNNVVVVFVINHGRYTITNGSPPLGAWGI